MDEEPEKNAPDDERAAGILAALTSTEIARKKTRASDRAKAATPMKVYQGAAAVLPQAWNDALGLRYYIQHSVIIVSGKTKAAASVTLANAGFIGRLDSLRVSESHNVKLLIEAGIIDLQKDPGIWVMADPTSWKIVQIDPETGETKVVATLLWEIGKGVWIEKLFEDDKVEQLLDEDLAPDPEPAPSGPDRWWGIPDDTEARQTGLVGPRSRREPADHPKPGPIGSGPISLLGIKVEPVMIDGKKFGDNVFIADVLIGFRPETGTAPKRIAREVFTALADVLQTTLGWPMTAQELFEQTVAEALAPKKKES